MIHLGMNMINIIKSEATGMKFFLNQWLSLLKFRETPDLLISSYFFLCQLHLGASVTVVSYCLETFSEGYGWYFFFQGSVQQLLDKKDDLGNQMDVCEQLGKSI